jgi:hypothetical protein
MSERREYNEHMNEMLRALDFPVAVSASSEPTHLTKLETLPLSQTGQLVVIIELSNGHTFECRMRRVGAA